MTPRIDKTAIVAVGHADIAEDVVIEAGVRIACDRLVLRGDTVIRRNVRIVTPHLECGIGTRIHNDVSIEVNDHCLLGTLADIWSGTRIVAHSVEAGDHLWISEGVLIGGGGARTSRAALLIGDRTAITDGCFINVCEPVTIGSDTALSNHVTVLTHSTWHGVLEGGQPRFAPVHIGDNVIVYANATITPGVTVGDGCTVGAASVVVRDVPARATAFGNPARVVSNPPSVPDAATRDALIRELLGHYKDTMPIKGGTASHIDGDAIAVTFNGICEIVRFEPTGAHNAAPTDASISLAAEDVAPHRRARCHFDVGRRSMTGPASVIAEDLRDFLRRRTVRIYTDRPFQSLPPADIARLRRQIDA